MPSVCAQAAVTADPASTAVLLAGPAGPDLWPGLHRSDGDSPARIRLNGRDRIVVIRQRAPRRTPTSFIVRFSVRGDRLPGGEGRITLTGAPGHTDVAFELTWRGRPAPELAEGARGFLANLADASEHRPPPGLLRAE
jgi:hypothetical protein